MTLKTEAISSIQPFWHIDCPVCGGDDFTELGTGGGVWCDQCNAEFRVRNTAGDPGCVVDCTFNDVTNILKRDGTKLAWRKALSEMGTYRTEFSDATPKLHAYRIMKEPGETGTYCTDDRGWILSLAGKVLTDDIPEVLKTHSSYKHLTGPLVSKEVALEYGEKIS